MAAGLPLKQLLAQDSLRGMDFETREHFIKTKLKMFQFLGIRGHHEAPMKHLAPPAPVKHPRTPQVDARRKHVAPAHKHMPHLGLATPKAPRKVEPIGKPRKRAPRHAEEAMF